VKDVQDSAKQGRFVQAFAQSRAILAASPTSEEMSTLKMLFSKHPQIQDAGVSAISVLMHTARTEQDLLRAQAQVLIFAKCVKSNLCASGALTGLQSRFAAVTSTLVLDAGIPVNFESNLLAEWIASTGASPGEGVERRIYQNTMASIAARDPRDAPSWIMTDRLFRYLLRHPEARSEAFGTIEQVAWPAPDLESPMREVYPDLVKTRWGEAGTSEFDVPAQTGSDQVGSAISFDTKGVEFGPWVRRFLSQVRRNWSIPNAAMSLRGHVSVSFNVHKDGTITDIVVVGPSKVDAFNTSSLNAIAASSPTVPLPPEYPEEKATITITFYYNETPPRR
jgi:TonB family protein